MTEAIRVLYIAAPEDQKYLRTLEKHLAELLKQDLNGWHAGMISPGQEHTQQIDKALDSAEIILLLVSADYMGSTECQAMEARALMRHRKGTAIVIPIIIRAADWEKGELRTLQVLPPDEKPVKNWQDQDEAWCCIVKGIRRVTEVLRA